MLHELIREEIIKITFAFRILLDWQEIDDLGVTDELRDVERTSVSPISEGTVLFCWICVYIVGNESDAD